MKRLLLLSILSLWILTSPAFSYTIQEVLAGVEKTTFEEYSIPYFQWFNGVSGEIRAGYDPFAEKGVIGAGINMEMFEKLDLHTDFSMASDFATDTSFRFSLGMTYDFLETGESEKRYQEAQREALRRKLEVTELFFSYLKKKVMMAQTNDPLQTTLNRLEQVEMAYITSKIEALSSISGEPQISGLSDYAPEKIENDVVELAVRMYLNTFDKTGETNDSFYALFSTDYNTFLQGVTAGAGGSLSFEEPVSQGVENKLDEIEIRRDKLYHNVLCEELPKLRTEYEALEKEINESTAARVQGKLTDDDIRIMKERLKRLENQYIELSLEAVKIETLFNILLGEN